jgi:transketolase
VLSRQGLPILDPDDIPADAIDRGAYVLRDSAKAQPELILVGTGSEVGVCLEAQKQLESEGVATRVVSMPCFDRFVEQDSSYRDKVLPPTVRARVSVEAGATLGWERIVGQDGEMIGMHGFGASGPAADLLTHFGFTAENVASTGRQLVNRISEGKS